jgi:hypothetical protein
MISSIATLWSEISCPIKQTLVYFSVWLLLFLAIAIAIFNGIIKQNRIQQSHTEPRTELVDISVNKLRVTRTIVFVHIIWLKLREPELRMPVRIGSPHKKSYVPRPGLARNQRSPFTRPANDPRTSASKLLILRRASYTLARSTRTAPRTGATVVLTLPGQSLGQPEQTKSCKSKMTSGVQTRARDVLHPGISTRRDAELPIRPLVDLTTSASTQRLCLDRALAVSLAGYIYMLPPGHQTIIPLQTKSKP